MHQIKGDRGYQGRRKTGVVERESKVYSADRLHFTDSYHTCSLCYLAKNKVQAGQTTTFTYQTPSDIPNVWTCAMEVNHVTETIYMKQETAVSRSKDHWTMGKLHRHYRRELRSVTL
uniref:DDE_Tnp_1 domain-containing protein n=1 Tax=Steinernema glaseri TaxID=37863 RepID=A0A1I7YUL5_9BILA